MTLRIGDLVETPPVQTVVRLEEGLSQSQNITTSFVFTAEVSDHLTALSYALERDTGQGYFLHGDFGSGKSHFLAALSAWLRRKPGWSTLTDSNEGLKRLAATNRRFLAVNISLVKYRSATSLETILLDAIGHALSEEGGKQRAHQASGERHEAISAAIDTVRATGFQGLVLVIDELSEFFRSKPDPAQLNEDARTLQLLGEIAFGAPLWIIAAVQESIERTGDIAQATFRKIKDRFPVRLHLSTLHIRDLISKRLVRRKPGADEHIFRIYQEYRQHFPLFACDYEFFRSIYPVHPTTLKLLEGLGELFSQHRGIVDFVHSRIAGDKSRSISGILDRPANELLAPDSIYDHFSGRLAEFSAFHVYPRHILPHLDEVIEATLEDEEDRRLARRLVRILVLYNIHPAAEMPSVRVLAELCACMLASHDPSVNVQFVSGALLDPLVAKSRFLSKRPSASGDPLDAHYLVTTREDHGKTLSARMERICSEISPTDTRLILGPLGELPASVSWPGPELLQGPVERSISWRNTLRRVLVVFVLPGSERVQRERIESGLSSGSVDFAFALTLPGTNFTCGHTAVWRLSPPGEESSALRESFAARAIAVELKPTSPADAPLLPLVKDTLRRLEPLVRQEALSAVYNGSFLDAALRPDPASLQLRRFDRLLEIAAEGVLEERYPQFKEIAPRSFPPSARLYQRLLVEYVAPGALSLKDARAKGLTEALETLAAPVGLAEVKGGSYRLSPNSAENPFLSHVFGLLRPSGPTMLNDFAKTLRTGPYGVPQETIEFLLVSLAHCGMVTLLNHGRSVPLDYLIISSLEKVDAVAPGEIIGQTDRDFLVASCNFLAPPGGWPTFGLRQQREAWQAALKYKSSLDNLLSETGRQLSSIGDYSAFDAFDFDALEKTLEQIRRVFDEVKVSYPAREGLERFIAAWRESRLTAEDLDRVRRMHRFLTKHVENFIFITHYLRNRSVENAAQLSIDVNRRREAVNLLLSDPEVLVISDEGIQLQCAFDALRETYAVFYAEHHGAYHHAGGPPELSKRAHRAFETLRKLSSIDVLDRPPGLQQVLKTLDAPAKAPCRRTIPEQLLRSPVCACGYQIGDVPEKPVLDKPEEAIDRLLQEYGRILSAETVREAATARAYAIKDLNPGAARRLEEFCAIVQSASGITSLLDSIDEHLLMELRAALAGSAKITTKPLAALATHLAGRRLTKGRILEAVRLWLDGVDDDTIISVDESSSSTGTDTPRADASWWPLLRPDLFSSKQVMVPPQEVHSWERMAETAFPSENLRPRLSRLETARLVDFITEEPFHTRAVQSAWTLLAERVLSRTVDPASIVTSSRHLIGTEAAAIAKRLETLKTLANQFRLPLPDRLGARLTLSTLQGDSWAAVDVQTALEAALSDLTHSAQDWLETLTPNPAVNLTDNPVVLIIDALAPDVWLDISSTIMRQGTGARLSWYRLTSEPQTVPAMNALFGFPAGRDPLDEFAARGVSYYQFSGDEPHGIRDLIPPTDIDRPLVIRLGKVDSSVHDSAVRLHEIPALVRSLLARRLPECFDVCSARRRLVLTADHGLSLYRRKLLHGRGGAFEQAIVRVEWIPS